MADTTPNNPKVKIRLVKSLLGRPEKHHRVVKALGLHKTNSEVVHVDSATIRGMIQTVIHLVHVEPFVA